LALPLSHPAQIAVPEQLSTQRSDLHGERRQLTVMFCDLVGSTALSTQLDPEELRAVIQAYRATCAAVIQAFDGHLAKYIGDGLLVYFGYPLAHEDDAQRAVRVGLGILAELPQLNTRLQSTIEMYDRAPLQIRIGIHTGLVVAGEMGVGDHPEPLAIVGETPNIAARLQALAQPDTVVISAATQRLVQGYFVYKGLGPRLLKGVSAPLEVYQVLGERDVQNRFEVAIRTGLTPLVGREEEMTLLRQRWEQAKAGEGQIVLLYGDPGIGKSRIVQEMKEQATKEGYTRIEFHCSPYYQSTAFYPVIDHLQRMLEFRHEDSPEDKLTKLEQTLTGYRLSLPEVMPLFAALLSLPHPAEYPPLSLTPQRQRQKTQEALVSWLLEEAKKNPVLAAWEDLHWADPSTLELHDLFIDRVLTTRIFTLLTFRPEFIPPWSDRSHLTRISLNRLGRPQVETMVHEMTAGKPLPLEVFQQVVSKTDGVPLFVEELTKMVLESGLLKEAEDRYELTEPLPPLAIPSTLHDSLMARLDRLSSVKEVVQLGATVGREFPYDLIQALSPLTEATLQRALNQLVEAELLSQRGVPPRAHYTFKHALIQDEAYGSLLRSKRQQVHQRIAQIFEERFPETAETHPELLAHHYTAANLKAEAIMYWRKAGERAAKRSANLEAVSHLSKGLDLLKALPDTPENAQQELTLLVTLGAPLVATKGYSAPEVEKTFTRARELCQQVGETLQLFPVLFRLRSFYLVHGDLQPALEVGEQLLRLAQSARDPALLLEAHYAVGAALFYLGEFVPTRDHFARMTALYDPEQHRSHAFLYGQDPGVAALSYEAWTLGYLGYADQALNKAEESLVLAQDLAHPFSLAFAWAFAAMFQQNRQDWRTTQELAEKAIALSSEHGFPLWLAMATMLRGWALTRQGQAEEGIAQMRRGLVTWRAIGAELSRPYFFTLLAEAYGRIGQPEEGLSLIAEGLAQVQKNEDRGYEAVDLYHLKGKLTLQQFQVSGSKFQVPPNTQQVEAEAEACFHQAIAVARRQQAKFPELRAVMSLSRLWQRQGRRKEARQELLKVYSWFTEGFDTSTMKEAKVLLAELA
jgi:class 3 adenylate cyclase/predicted ATPase